MKTAIPNSTKALQNPARNSHAPFSNPQSGRLAQLASMMNQSPQVQTQLKLSDEIQNSEPVQNQLALAEQVNHVPVAQPRLREENEPVQREEVPSPNHTGLPDQLKAGVENLSGISLDDVKVHYNSAKPAQLNALAYAQGTDIHVAPRQERHLPHEAWHIVQQKQGRVQPTMQMKAGVPVNDDEGLEREADVMGARAMQMRVDQAGPSNPAEGNVGCCDPLLNNPTVPAPRTLPSPGALAVQRKIGFEFEMGDIETMRYRGGQQSAHSKGAILARGVGYNITADISQNGSQIEFVTDQFDETDPDDMDDLAWVAALIEDDVKDIVAAASQQAHGWVQVSAVLGSSGKDYDYLHPKANRRYEELPGQLQMTGGVNIYALAGVVSGTALPERDANAAQGTVYEDYAISYGQFAPSGALQQPIFQAASGAVDGFVSEKGPKKKGIAGKVRGALAAVVTLMAEIPLNARNELPQYIQGQFLARTDYSKILKLICDDSGIDIEPDTFAQALLSTINQVSSTKLALDDDVFPAAYSAAGQTFTGVSIGDWARSVVPAPGRFWGRWQGTDLITKRNFPGTQAQKDELRAFGGFGDKTDPGNKIILEWRNLQMMNADHLVFVMTGLAKYLRKANAR